MREGLLDGGYPHWHRRVIALAILLAIPAGLVWIYSHDPLQNLLFPTCPFFFITGLNCPGCGGTRAIHALLHGHTARALWYNPFAILIAPVLLLWLVRECVRMMRGRQGPFPNPLPGYLARG